jgi:hypothetical protein
MHCWTGGDCFIARGKKADGFDRTRLTLLERMAGTTGLEPAASAVTEILGVLYYLTFNATQYSVGL